MINEGCEADPASGTPPTAPPSAPQVPTPGRRRCPPGTGRRAARGRAGCQVFRIPDFQFSTHASRAPPTPPERDRMAPGRLGTWKPGNLTIRRVAPPAHAQCGRRTARIDPSLKFVALQGRHSTFELGRHRRCSTRAPSAVPCTYFAKRARVTRRWSRTWTTG